MVLLSARGRVSHVGDQLAPEDLYLAAAGLAPTGIHVLRHTAAKLRRDAGESIEEVSAFLDHSSLAVTTVYLRRLEGQEDRAWRDVADAIGV
jgi:integrase